MPEPTAAQIYWRSNLRLLAALLAVWFAVSFGCGILFVEWLNGFRIGGFPLGFWFAQQGSIYVFVLLILVYSILLDRLDRRTRIDGGGTPGDGGQEDGRPRDGRPGDGRPGDGA